MSIGFSSMEVTLDLDKRNFSGKIGGKSMTEVGLKDRIIGSMYRQLFEEFCCQAEQRSGQ